MDPTRFDDVEAYVQENREMLVRVLRHSNDEFARACAWTLLDEGSSEPELEQLQDELEAIREGVA